MARMTRLFVRCNGGDYFQGTQCPWDGWSMHGVQEVVAAFADLSATRERVSLRDVQERVSIAPELLRRLLVVELGDDSASFDALAPARYFHRGEEVTAPADRSGVANLPDELM